MERLQTRQGVRSFGVLAATGLVSAMVAGLLPPRLGIWAGFVYSTLRVTMPVIAIRHGRQVERLQKDA